MTDHHEHIRVRAFHLWEQAGKPEHRDQEFWIAAEQEYAAEQASKQMAPEPPPVVGRSPKAGNPSTHVEPPVQATSLVSDAVVDEKRKKPKAPAGSKAKATAKETDTPAAAPPAPVTAKPSSAESKKKPKK